MSERGEAFLSRVRYGGAVILTAVILLFALQNLNVVRVDFLIWEIETSVSLIALVTFLAGLVVGGLSTLFRMRRKLKAKAPSPQELPPSRPLEDLPRAPADQKSEWEQPPINMG